MTACDPVWEVTPTEVHRRMVDGDSDLVLLDCRRPAEFEIVTLERARLIPMDEIPGRLDELADARAKNHDIVVYCRTGVRSLSVAAFLREQGFDDVRSMAGGLHRWSAEVDSTVPCY